MKSLIFLSCLIMQSASAVFPQIDVRNVHGDYLDGKGQAYAQKAYYVLPKVKIKHENIVVTFNRNEKNLVIKDPSTTVELEFDFSFLNVFKAFAFTDVNINSNTKIFSMSSGELDLFIEPTKYHIEEGYIETDIKNLPSSEVGDITILDGLLFNGAFTFKKLTFSDFNEFFFNELKIENPQHTLAINALEKAAGDKINIPMIVRKAKFNINKGKFAGSALMDSYINLWFRINGDVKSNKENTILEITISRAKVGYFSVRGTLLKRIRNMKLDNVTVVGNKIIIDLSSIVFGQN
jgi:hypothetical protein